MHEAIDYRRLGTRSGDLENPLPDRKLMRDGCRPNRRVVDRHVAHSEGGEASVQKFAFHQSGCTSMLSIVVRKEEVADAEASGAEIGAPGDLAEEPEGEVNRDTAAVADASEDIPPRCGTEQSASRPLIRTSWVCTPSLRVMNPTPQLLLSSEGSYKPTMDVLTAATFSLSWLPGDCSTGQIRRHVFRQGRASLLR